MAAAGSGSRVAGWRSAVRPLVLTGAIGLVPLVLIQLFPARLQLVIPGPQYLPFHDVVELLGVVTDLSIFGVGWFTHEQTRDRHALVVSCLFLAVGVIALLHMLCFPGMPDFITSSALNLNKAPQLWILMRGVLAAGLLASAFVSPDAGARVLERRFLGPAALAVAAAALWAVVLRPGTLPAAWVSGVGLTALKVGAEYVIIAVLLAAIVAYARAEGPRGGTAGALYLAALALSVLAEACFTLFRNMTDTVNALGHLYVLASYLLVYRAMFIDSVQRPHRDLVESARLLRAERDCHAEARAALGRERDRVAAIMESSPVALVRVDADGAIAYANAEAERLLGLSRGEIMRRSYDAPEWSICDPSGAPLDPRELPFSVIAATRAPVRTRHGIRWPDGRLVILDVIGAPLLGAAGQFDGAVLGLEDATERSRMQDQLQHAQRMEAVGRLAGGVAHDFNNLLTAILGATDALLERLPAGSELRPEADEIEAAARKGANLTRQLLTFSRKQVVVPRILDPDDLIAKLLPVLRRLIGEAVELSVRGTCGGANVRADPGQLEQVIVNLVVNARDALREGSGHIALEVAEIRIGEEEARQQLGVRAGAFVRVSVIDDGCGISPELRSHLFEPFFTTKGPGKGTGLGLSTVYGIVRQCGGHVAVESEPGQGSVFRVYLPCVAAEATPAESFSRGASPQVVGTILVVEDDHQVREVVVRALGRAGHTVIEAATPSDALAVSAERLRSLDLLVTDVVMPGLRGDEVARRLRALRPDLRVLFMSGYTGEDFVRGEDDPATGFLAKPFSPGALVEAVDGLLVAQVGRSARAG
jgi:PAS domain S-box-containing protein